MTDTFKIDYCDRETCPFYSGSLVSSNDGCEPPSGDSFYFDECGREGGFPTKCPLRNGPVTVAMADKP